MCKSLKDQLLRGNDFFSKGFDMRRNWTKMPPLKRYSMVRYSNSSYKSGLLSNTVVFLVL